MVLLSRVDGSRHSERPIRRDSFDLDAIYGSASAGMTWPSAPSVDAFDCAKYNVPMSQTRTNFVSHIVVFFFLTGNSGVKLC